MKSGGQAQILGALAPHAPPSKRHCVCTCGQYRMVLDVMETFQFNALAKKAAKYRPYDGKLTVNERSLFFAVY